MKVYEGGRFEDRLFLLMNRAPGQELEKRLAEVPRTKIRQIIDQVARACIFLRKKGLCHRDIKTSNIFISDDFELITLLDLSVTRAINDPVGIGTDHDGQLPVVATSRYSPPEYLFRLVEPSASLWHAVDVYQLGGVLHDLTMREPLFQKEYRLSQENRYRFAWVVATVNPVVYGADVDQDLILLARRALDKDFGRRTELQLEDFLSDFEVRRTQGLEALGLSLVRRKKTAKAPAAHRRVSEAARSLESAVIEHLRRHGVTATHDIGAGASDASKKIEFRWQLSRDEIERVLENVSFRILLTFEQTAATSNFYMSATLSAATAVGDRKAYIDLPSVPDDADAIDALTHNAIAVLGDLAVKVLQVSETSEGDG